MVINRESLIIAMKIKQIQVKVKSRTFVCCKCEVRMMFDRCHLVELVVGEMVKIRSRNEF